MSAELRGKTALVTGGTSGIGRAVVEHLAEVGMQVAFCGRDAERGASVAAASGASFIRSDATDRDDCDRSVEQAASLLGGRLDLFVGCAAMIFAAPLGSTPEPIFRELVEVNLTATFRYSRACFEVMRRQGRGVITHVVSDAALRGIHHIPAYSVTKAGVLALSETLAAEAAPHGVRVNAICPGAVFPGMQTTPEGYEHHAEDASTWGSAPSGRHGTGRDVSNAVLWLASEAAAHVSGATLRLDGAAGVATRGVSRA
ncbi:MAG: SDR family oxidoreductase [Acidimicrobiia bacterium]|nr:SDR family oxidoreductase [Acidimicrobiia bacterium]MYC45070.1 SDR family oxidoreductase [Acidimicrobiia bacterium]MYI20446.1 SDR family oxidoreductase [Acidimicrobiia bacterium]